MQTHLAPGIHCLETLEPAQKKGQVDSLQPFERFNADSVNGFSFRAGRGEEAQIL